VTPVVSVVVPIYNRPHTIATVIETLRRQTLTAWEALLVDDGSAQDPSDAMAAYADDPRIQLIRLPENRGVSAARNTGVAAATGTYVAFLDSDDDWLPEKLARQVAALEAEPDDRAFCVTLTTVVMPGGWERVRPNFDPAPGRSFAEYLYCDGGFAQASALFLPRGLAQAIPFREALRQYEDHLYFIELAASGLRYVVVREALSRWINDERPDRLSAQDDLARGDAFLALGGAALSPRARTAFQIRVQGPALLAKHPGRALWNMVKAVPQGALSLPALGTLIAKQILPVRIWDVVRSLAA
jgi:glycosyltransferase involved in cell wall biosynthesis